MTSGDLSLADELTGGLEITDTDLSFSENSQILNNNELLDPKHDNEFIKAAIYYPHHVAQMVMIWIKNNYCKVF